MFHLKHDFLRHWFHLKCIRYVICKMFLKFQKEKAKAFLIEHSSLLKRICICNELPLCVTLNITLTKYHLRSLYEQNWHCFSVYGIPIKNICLQITRDLALHVTR